MLVLSRKRNERIRINKDTWVTIVEIRGDKVRVGIDAPDGVPIEREELIHDHKPPHPPDVGGEG